MHDLLPLIKNPQISHNLISSEQNSMKLKINFKQTRATSAGDINSPNLLVYIIYNICLTKQNFKHTKYKQIKLHTYYGWEVLVYAPVFHYGVDRYDMTQSSR